MAEPVDPNEDFWGFYLHEHAHPNTRLVHVLGTTLALAFLVAAVVLPNAWMLIPAVVVGYAFAWTAHFFIEHNKPATFRFPFRSLASDWKLWALTLTGQIGKHLDHYGLSKRS